MHRRGGEQGIGHGVEERITIAVSNGALPGLQPHAADDERPTGAGRSQGFEAMEVVSVANPERFRGVKHRG